MQKLAVGEKTGLRGKRKWDDFFIPTIEVFTHYTAIRILNDEPKS